MSADWRRLTREAGLRLDGDTIEVTFGDQRRQTVYVETAGDGMTLRLWSIVARPAALSMLHTPDIDGWRRNRLSELLGFSIDVRGRMIGESWLPVAGLTSDEWEYCVRNLAKGCDRFEYLITGKDES